MKITVIKKLNNNELFGENPPLHFVNSAECDWVRLGQEFISDEGSLQKGMCASAFADIQRDIIRLRLGGDYPFFEEKGAILSCRTDGARSVIFKLERIDE